MLRVLALGNRLRKDDAVAIEAAEYLVPKLNKKGIDVIIGDVNYEYCFDKLNEDDFIILLTSVYSHRTPGTIHISKISDNVIRYSKDSNSVTANKFALNIFELMNLYCLSYTGFVIKISVDNIEFTLGMSSYMKDSFYKICDTIEFLINKISILSFT